MREALFATQSVLVTGAGGGLGRASARLFAAESGRLPLCQRARRLAGPRRARRRIGVLLGFSGISPPPKGREMNGRSGRI